MVSEGRAMICIRCWGITKTNFLIYSVCRGCYYKPDAVPGVWTCNGAFTPHGAHFLEAVTYKPTGNYSLSLRSLGEHLGRALNAL